jgi:exosortase A
MLMQNPPGVVDAPTRPASTGRAALLLVVLALLAPFALYLGTVRSIVDIWNSSDTFAHGYVILPISLWLIWRRRENFKTFPPTPFWPALLLLAGAGAAWLAAQLGQVQVVQQYAFVSMLPVMALALFGWRLAGSLAFPLLFVLFAVPFGEIFVAPLIEFTADCTVWLVQLTGIPVLRSGTRFELPTGSWSVVEACSGVRYLISSVTLGCLYAYLTYRSTARHPHSGRSQADDQQGDDGQRPDPLHRALPPLRTHGRARRTPCPFLPGHSSSRLDGRRRHCQSPLPEVQTRPRGDLP